jgi:hypothetical protein
MTPLSCHLITCFLLQPPPVNYIEFPCGFAFNAFLGRMLDEET